MKKGKILMQNKSKLNSIKKTKVQFSTRFSKCLGEHQCQEFFERLNITRQTGICSKSKNNSFGEIKSHSFRQTLQLNVPFVADFSDFKNFCVCYPVHFFRKKLQNTDYEDCRLASVRIYYPASRMKYGNDFKISVDHKKRIHLHPHQYEFVAYPNLLTLSLEDLALAVFRAKSLSEKFKIFHSLPIPKMLLSSTNISSQIGSPIFIATERIYSRLCKLIACGQKNSFPLNNSFTNNSDPDFYSKKCILKWIGVSDFLPLSSRLIFVRRLSTDCGDTLACSILNSSGPKIRRSRIKGDRFSIRLKQSKVCAENDESMMKLLIEPLVSFTETEASQSQNVKRSRGRPKKSVHNEEKIVSEYSDDNFNSAGLLTASSNHSDKLKTESVSNSLFDSTSEEKYSIHLSSCSTPDTIKSHSPNALNVSLTAAINSTVSMCQVSPTKNGKNIIKNQQNILKKHPSIIQDDSYIRLTLSKNKSGNFEVLSKNQEEVNDEQHLTNQKLLNSSYSKGQFNEIPRKTMETSFSVNDISKETGTYLDSTNSCETPYCLHQSDTECLSLSVHSMWKPLRQPLPPPDPIVPLSKSISSTGKERNPDHKFHRNITPDNLRHDKSKFADFSTLQNHFNKVDNIDRDLSTEFSQPKNMFSNLNLPTSCHDYTKFSVEDKILSKENNFNNFFNCEKNNIEHNLLNSLIIPPSPVFQYKHEIYSSYHNNNNNNNNFPFPNPAVTNNLPPPFLSINLHPPFSSIKSLSDDTFGQPSLSVPSSNNSHLWYEQNPMLVTNSLFNYPKTLTGHHSNNSNIYPNEFDISYPLWSWSNAFQWKY